VPDFHRSSPTEQLLYALRIRAVGAPEFCW
jgi:hypothetical protein